VPVEVETRSVGLPPRSVAPLGGGRAGSGAGAGAWKPNGGASSVRGVKCACRDGKRGRPDVRDEVGRLMAGGRGRVAGEAFRAAAERTHTGGETTRAGGEATRTDGTATLGSPGSEGCEYSDPDDEASPPSPGVRVSSVSGVAGMTARVKLLPRAEKAGLAREGGVGVPDLLPLPLFERVWVRGGKGFGVVVLGTGAAGAMVGYVALCRGLGVDAGFESV
jgi:hypothetical protein